MEGSSYEHLRLNLPQTLQYQHSSVQHSYVDVESVVAHQVTSTFLLSFRFVQ
jgi:hypothetical protein